MNANIFCGNAWICKKELYICHVNNDKQTPPEMMTFSSPNGNSIELTAITLDGYRCEIDSLEDFAFPVNHLRRNCALLGFKKAADLIEHLEYKVQNHTNLFTDIPNVGRLQFVEA